MLFSLLLAHASPSQVVVDNPDFDIELSELARLGERLSIEAELDGSVASFGEDVVIDRTVDGDVFVMGGRLVVTRDAKITGNVVAVAADVELRGFVGGDVDLVAERAVLGARVEGDVDMAFKQLHVARGASIRGDLEYAAPTAQPQLEAITKGSIRREAK